MYRFGNSLPLLLPPFQDFSPRFLAVVEASDFILLFLKPLRLWLSNWVPAAFYSANWVVLSDEKMYEHKSHSLYFSSLKSGHPFNYCQLDFGYFPVSSNVGMHHLPMEICSDKCIIRRFYYCVNTIEVLTQTQMV